LPGSSTRLPGLAERSRSLIAHVVARRASR